VVENSRKILETTKRKTYLFQVSSLPMKKLLLLLILATIVVAGCAQQEKAKPTPTKENLKQHLST